MPQPLSALAVALAVALAAHPLVTGPPAARAQTAPAARPAAPNADRDQMERPEVREVVFRGVKAVSRSDLAQSLATKASSCNSLFARPFCLFTKSSLFYERRYLEPEELPRDVVRLLVFYYRRGWREAQVDTAVTRAGPGEVRVTFTVREGAPTLVRQVLLDDTTRTFRPRRRQRLVGLRRGDPLDLLRLDSAVVRLRDAYWEAGYADAVVSAPVIGVDSVADTAAVRIPVRRGLRQRIDSIVVLNQTPDAQVSEETIRNSMVVKQGDVFKRSAVAQSQRGLYESGLFRSAVLDTAVTTIPGTGRVGCASQAGLRDTPVRPPIPDEPPPDSTKTLVVCLLEGPFREVRTSVGFSTADFGQAEARFTNNYWLGGPRRLELSGVIGNLGAAQLYNTPPFRGANGFTVGGDAFRDIAQQGRYFAPTYQIGADVRRRYFLSPRNTLGLGIFTHRRSAPAVFVDRGQGANLSFTRDVAPQVPVSAAYRFELNRVEASDVYFCVNFAVCDRSTANALARQQRLSPLAVTGAVNRTDHPFSPTRGLLARFGLEYASAVTLSDFAYARGQLEASTYRRVPFRRSVLALRGRVGYVRALAGTNRRLGVTRVVEGSDLQLLHPRTRFYAGGSQSVRGFGENQLGPRVLTVDPRRLLTAEGNTCGGDVRRCDLNATRVVQDPRGTQTTVPVYGDDDFVARPLGGTALLEGNVELRVPIRGPIVGALFVDGAVLGERSLGRVGEGTRALTPGVGVRYQSPVGPVRVDLGFRPRLAEALPVVTQETVDGVNQLLELNGTQPCTGESVAGCRRFPTEAPTSLLNRVTRRLTLHLSIGEAF
jgi:outer membrane protein insertion porin family/translocation and assembly module TamA